MPLWSPLRPRLPVADWPSHAKRGAAAFTPSHNAVMSFGPQHDFRAKPHERKDEALEFFRVELPDSTVTSFPVDKAAAYHCLVVEECDHTEGRVESLAESLDGVVHSVDGVDHYPQGAEIYFHA